MMIEAAAVATGTVGWFLNKVFGPSADILGADLAERFRTRRDTVIRKAAEQLKMEGVEPRQVADDVLVPILQYAGLVSNEDLQAHWAALLAAAADPRRPAVPPSFPAILAQLSPLDARMVRALFVGLEANNVPPNSITAGIRTDDLPAKWGVPADDIAVSVENLLRLGLTDTGTLTVDGKTLTVNGDPDRRFSIQNRDVVCPTPLGWAFHRACKTPGVAGQQ